MFEQGAWVILGANDGFLPNGATEISDTRVSKPVAIARDSVNYGKLYEYLNYGPKQKELEKHC